MHNNDAHPAGTDRMPTTCQAPCSAFCDRHYSGHSQQLCDVGSVASVPTLQMRKRRHTEENCPRPTANGGTLSHWQKRVLAIVCIPTMHSALKRMKRERAVCANTPKNLI